MSTEFPQNDLLDGVIISSEDAKSIINILQNGMINLSDDIEASEIKTQLASERTQERLFEAEEELRMKFDESKRINEILKEAINENEKRKQQHSNLEARLGDCCKHDHRCAGEDC